MRRYLPLTLLVLLTSACSQQELAPVDQVRSGLRRALGPGTDTVRTLNVRATVRAPGGDFETQIGSTTTGSVRLKLGSSLLAGVYRGEGWSCDTLQMLAPLDSVVRTVVRGHDLHTLVLSPTWLAAATLDSSVSETSDSLITIRFQDELGAPLLLHLRRPDTLPVSLDLVNHSGQGPRDVHVQFSEWEDLGGVRLFRRAVFLHGGNQFEYDYRDIAINTVADTTLAPSCSP